MGEDRVKADGMAVGEILAACPNLEREDVQEALRYGAEAVRERELPPTRRGEVSRR
jgi:uncharacterized protein (DUF433 family)